MAKTILLSFDVEEFNLPLEYNLDFSSKNQFEFSFNGLKKVLALLDKFDIKATFFVTASFASKYPKILKEISEKHEIASHGLNHKINRYVEREVEQSKAILEMEIGKKINGFRFPRLQKPDFASLSKMGFKYDSSISPTYLPKRYNNYFENKKINLKKGIYEVPVSTFPLFRIPVSWIFVRNLGLKYLKLATLFSFKSPGFVNLFFHPWEFTELDKLKIPWYIKRNSGEKLITLLEKYISWCKKNKFKFHTFSEFLKLPF